jgi:histidine triad (HIT) family protein
MDDCLFCKIIKKEIPANIVYEDKNVIAFLDLFPIHPGHTLVLPKKHYLNIFDAPSAELEKCMKVIKKLSLPVAKATGAHGINIGQNNEKAAGQAIMHLHFHIIPRYNNDGLKAWPNRGKMTDAQLNQLQKKIIGFI